MVSEGVDMNNSCTRAMFQENPLPDPAELFTNVYVKGFGTEVFPLFPFAQLLHYNYLVNLSMSAK